MFSWSLHTTRFLPDPFCTLFGHVSKHAHCKFQDTYHALFRRAQHVKAYNEFVKEHLTSRFLRGHVGRCWVTSHNTLPSYAFCILFGLAAQHNSQSTLYVVWPRYTRLFHTDYFACRPVTSHNTPSFCCLVTPLIPISSRACCSLFVRVTQNSLSQRVLRDRTTQQPWIIIHWN